MGIPKPTAERLARLAQLLEQRQNRTVPVSSGEIEQLTGWASHTIRKDISLLGAGSTIAGSTGYDPERLSRAIRDALGFTGESRNCCIVGLGRLGSAFLEYSGFYGSHFTLCAGFDSNVNRVEILKADFPLFPSYKMKEVIPRMGIRYAILAVPPSQAVQTAEKLVECGITGIVNFTPVILPLPQTVEVEQVSVIDALSKLAARLAVTQHHAAASDTTQADENTKE